MKIEANNIPLLLCKKATGKITQEENAILLQWVNENDDNKKAYEEFMNKDFLEKELNTALGIDTQAPRIKMEKRIKAPRRSQLRYAAAIAILIIAGAGYWYSQYTKVTPPEISEAVQLAMQQSIQSGKQEAEVFEVRGEKNRGERIDSGAGKQEQGKSLTSHPSPLTPENLSSLTKDQLLAAKRITTRHDKEFWLTLDDGTLVHLNYNTRLIYPEKFGRGDRNVILDGEAYFMVAKDRSRPFIVHTPNGDVKVYGTEFNVNTRTESKSLTSNTTSVVLVKGSVSVTPTGGKETMLKPGQQATVNVQSSMPNGQSSMPNGQSSIVNRQSSMVNGQSSTVNVENVDVEPYVAWNTGWFVFHEWPLERIMNILSRWYGYEVEYGSDKLRNITLSGDFDRYKDISTTLDALADVTELNISIKNGKIIIIK